MIAATTIEEYLASLPEERRIQVEIVRKVILENIQPGFEECMSYGMIGYVVPHSIFPDGYHCNPKLPLQYANLGAKKNYVSLHLMSVDGNSELLDWFTEAYQASGKKLDMGQACLRFKKIDDLALDVIGELFAKVSLESYVDHYVGTLSRSKKK